MIDINCVGGVCVISVYCLVIFMFCNFVIGVFVVIEWDIEDMLWCVDRDDYDFYMLSGDGIVCYDSIIINVVEVVCVLGLVVVGVVFN